MEDANPIDGRDPISRFVDLTREGYDEYDPEHRSALAQLMKVASAAKCDDMGAIIVNALSRAAGENKSYSAIRKQFPHGSESED